MIGISARTLLGALDTPEVQANAVVWHCSYQASMVTGASLPVGGGYLLGK